MREACQESYDRSINCERSYYFFLAQIDPLAG